MYGHIKPKQPNSVYIIEPKLIHPTNPFFKKEIRLADYELNNLLDHSTSRWSELEDPPLEEFL